MKKWVSILLCVIFTVTMLAGCGTSKPATDDKAAKQDTQKEEVKADSVKSAEPVTISWFTEQMNDTEVAGVKKYIIEPFEAKFPNIKVKHMPTADWNQVLKVQMAAGEGPDFFGLDGPTVATEYQSANRLLDLTPYVAKYNWDKKIFSWALNTCKISDKVFSIPNSYEGLVLWYNEKMFKDNNWEAPKTYADLEKIANESKKKGLMPFTFGTSNFKPANEWFISIALSEFAGPANVKKALTGEIKWTDDSIKGSIAALVKMWQDGWLNNKNSQAVSTDDSQVLFLQEKAAMKMEGTWFYGQFMDKKPSIKFNMSTFPSLNDGVTPNIPMAIGAVWGVNAKTKYPDQVAEFINFIVSNPAQHAKGVEEAGFQTLPVEYKAEMFSDKMDPVQKNMITTLAATSASGNFGYCTWTFWPPETRNFMIDNIEKVFFNKMTLDDYLKGTQAAFDKEKAAGKVPMIP